MSEVERNKSVIRAFVAAINGRDWARLESLVADDFIRHSHAAGTPQVRSRAQLEAFLRGELDTFPDGAETIEDIFGEGDRVAVRHRFRGQQLGAMGPYPPSGRVMDAEYLAIYRLEKQRIVEAWVEWDNVSGLTQLGHFRSPA